MLKIFIKFVSAFLVLIGISCSSQQTQTYDPDHRFDVGQVQEDLRQLGNVLKNHPALAYTVSSINRRELISELFNEANEPMTLIEFYYLAGRLTDPLNCGHTYLKLPEPFWEFSRSTLKHLPFKLFFQSRRAYLWKKYSPDSTIALGSEIVSVNGESIEAIIDRFRLVTTSDGPAIYEYAKMNRIYYGLFPGYPEFPEHYDITYMPPGDSSARTASVDARTHADIMEMRNHQFPVNFQYQTYEFEVLDSLSTAVMTIRDFVIFPKVEYEQFLEHSFTVVHEQGISNLIVDVRDNDGGDPAHAAAVLSYLVDREIIYFKRATYQYKAFKRPLRLSRPGFRGNLFVLMDGGCFSTTGHLLSLFKYHKLGVLIGEQSGGSHSCYGCPKSYTLSNTGLSLDCQRCVFVTEVTGFEIGRGVMPNIEVRPVIEDLARGRDTVKRFTLDLIKSKRQSSR